MLKSDDLRTQHDELIRLTTQITKEFTSTKDSAALFDLFSSLTEVLLKHLTLEDQTLYPFMLNSDNLNIRTMAKEFKLEMGDIAPVYIDFTKKYSSVIIIENNFEECHADTKNLFSKLIHRIIRENTILFPTYDKLI